MTANALVVLMGDRIAGRLDRLPGGKVRFVYEDGYVSDGNAQPTPLSVSMPTQRGEHPDHIVSPWLWGLLPDNEQVLGRWSRQFQVSAGSAFSLLSTPIGEDCPGAVRLVVPERIDAVLTPENKQSDVDWLTEADVAQRLRDLVANHTAWLGASMNGRFSLAGAQAKTALLRSGDRWGDPHGASATTHILKPAIAGLDEHDLNEHLCLTAMSRLGLLTVRTRVERYEDQTAIVVARYDRRRDVSGHQVRVHQEDLCQALSKDPRTKYQNEGGPGPADVTALLRRTMPRTVAITASRLFLDALLVNWLITGTDAHAKNYSLLLQGSQVRLAPLYDVASALPYQFAEQKLRLAMKFGSGYLVNPQSSPWKRLAADVGIGEDAVRDRAADLTERITDAFADTAADPEVAELSSTLPARMVSLIQDRASRCRKLL
jgi:serine/threonine-protein kinase HipA